MKNFRFWVITVKIIDIDIPICRDETVTMYIIGISFLPFLIVDQSFKIKKKFRLRIRFFTIYHPIAQKRNFKQQQNVDVILVKIDFNCKTIKYDLSG